MKLAAKEIEAAKIVPIDSKAHTKQLQEQTFKSISAFY